MLLFVINAKKLSTTNDSQRQSNIQQEEYHVQCKLISRFKYVGLGRIQLKNIQGHSIAKQQTKQPLETETKSKSNFSGSSGLFKRHNANIIVLLCYPNIKMALSYTSFARNVFHFLFAQEQNSLSLRTRMLNCRIFLATEKIDTICLRYISHG